MFSTLLSNITLLNYLLLANFIQQYQKFNCTFEHNPPFWFVSKRLTAVVIFKMFSEDFFTFFLATASRPRHRKILSLTKG